MDVAFFAPVAVGVVPGPGRFTVVVKATLSIARDGEAVPAAMPRPLDVERASDTPGELSSASDFVASKARADVLLVGHARSAGPAQIIVAGFAVGGIERRFVARSAAPLAEIPLQAAYLRAGLQEGAAHVRVGPGAPDARGNVAPPEQQTDGLRGDARLVLDGLFAGSGRRDVRLPGLEPLVYVVDRATWMVRAAVALTLDTLTIDTDAAECTLVWRGTATAAGLAQPCLAVGLDRVGATWAPAKLLVRLAGAPWGTAAEPEARPITRPPPRPPGVDLTKTVAFEDAPLPFRAPPVTLPFAQKTPAIVEQPRPPRAVTRKGTFTDTLDVSRIRAPALPFGAPAPAPAPPPIAPPPIAPAPVPSSSPPSLAEPPVVMEPPRPPPVAEPPSIVAPSEGAVAPEPELLSIEAYVAVRADLARGGRKREVLARHGLTPAAWKREERRQTAALEAEAMAGRTARAAALSAALEAAWPTPRAPA